MSLYFVLCVRYSRIKQQMLVDKIKSFTERIRTQKRKLRLGVHEIWHRFVAINSEILEQFDELHAYNRFWAKFVTIYFIGYIGMMGYLAYGFFFDKTEFDFNKRSFFIYFSDSD